MRQGTVQTLADYSMDIVTISLPIFGFSDTAISCENTIINDNNDRVHSSMFCRKLVVKDLLPHSIHAPFTKYSTRRARRRILTVSVLR